MVSTVYDKVGLCNYYKVNWCSEGAGTWVWVKGCRSTGEGWDTGYNQ